MPKKRRKRRAKRRIRFGRILLLLLLVATLFFGVQFIKYKNALKPIQATSEEVNFTVNYGDSLQTVTKNLEEEGLIRNQKMAYYFAKFNKLDQVLAGDYVLDKKMSVEEILTDLNDVSKAIVYDAKVTIIEGDWAKDIASKIAAVTNVSEEELLSLWNDDAYIQSLMPRYPFLTNDIFNEQIRFRLEGYLAPNTYNFFQETTAQEVTEKILDETNNVYTAYQSQIQASPLSIHQIFTLASIVQYEAATTEDMGMVSGVFYNRMAIDMPLQSSVTVCYAIDMDKTSDDWTACEVNAEFDSPYNTYQVLGLPPGPIMNPGKDAFAAVLNPIESDYYYFMADVETGKVYYARTLEEHNQNIARYMK